MKPIECIFGFHDWEDNPNDFVDFGFGGNRIYSRVCLGCGKYNDLVSKKKLEIKEEVQEIKEKEELEAERKKKRDEILKGIK